MPNLQCYGIGKWGFEVELGLDEVMRVNSPIVGLIDLWNRGQIPEFLISTKQAYTGTYSDLANPNLKLFNC